MTRIVLVVLLMATGLAHADRSAAYVDEVAVFGGPQAHAAREPLIAALGRAGYQAVFALATEAPCGDRPACLADRARAVGAAFALRVTIAEVSDVVMVSITSVDARSGRVRRHVAQGADLSPVGEALAAVLAREVAPDRAGRARRMTPWLLGGASVLLAAGGLFATWRAHDLQSQFFADHVDTNGDVHGISAEAARDAEAHAQRWSYAGGALLAGAAGTGITATVWFFRDRDREEPRPVGIAVSGTF